MECLILSRIDYYSAVYRSLPDYMINRLQRIQNAAAAYVLKHFTNTNDVCEKLHWLPIKERFDFAVTKLAYKALNDPTWPDYLPVTRYQSRRQLRSSKDGNLIQRTYITNTFPDDAALQLFFSINCPKRILNLARSKAQEQSSSMAIGLDPCLM